MRRRRTMRKVRTRAFLFVTLILSPVVQARPQECGKPTPPHCRDDCTGKKFYHDVSNKTCQPCTAVCGPGFNLIGTCGGSEGSDSSCEPLCTRGSFYDQKRNRCTGCGICDHTVGDVLCNATHDTICGPCRPGFFHLKDYPGLCHPCDYQSDTEEEPQCWKKDAPTTTPFLDTMSTDTSPITQQDFTSAAKVETATTNRSNGERTTLMIQIVHTDKGSHLERSSTEKSVVGEPVPEDDQVDESDKGFTLNQYILVGACVLVLALFLVTLYICKRTIQQKRSQQTQRQSQRQNDHDYAHEHIEEGYVVPNDDAINCNEGKVSIDVRDSTAQVQRTKSTDSPTLGTSLNQGFLSTRSHSHSHLPQHVFSESICNGSSGYISGDSQHRTMSYFTKQVPSPEIKPSCDHTSTSMGNILVHNEPEVFTNKKIACNELAMLSSDDLSIFEPLMSHEKYGKCSRKSHQKMHKGQTFQELPFEMKPLMMGKGTSTDDHLDREENENSLDREENQPIENVKSEAVSVAVQWPSLKNLASNDGTNLEDSDKVGKDEKQCTARPELEATVCVPRQVQTEPVSDMLPSNSIASADGPLTFANASTISTSDIDNSSTPKAAEPGTTSCKQGDMQTIHPEVPDTHAMQWKILGMLDTVVSSAFGKSSTEKSLVSLSANQEAAAACGPEKTEKSAKRSTTRKLGDGSESDGPDRMSSAVPPAISTPESKCISVNCSGNNNTILVMDNRQ